MKNLKDREIVPLPGLLLVMGFDKKLQYFKIYCILKQSSTSSREPCPSPETELKAHPYHESTKAQTSSYSQSSKDVPDDLEVTFTTCKSKEGSLIVTTDVRNTITKDTKLPSIILLILSLVIFACAFGYTMYRREADKRTLDKKRNHYNDRV